MKRLVLSAILITLAANLAAQNRKPSSAAKTPQSPTATHSPTSGALQSRVEGFLRKIYAWGPAFRVKVGPLKDAAVPGFYEVPVEVTYGSQSDTSLFYVTKDGRYLLRGDMQDMSSDPMAAVRSQLRLANNPSKGPADARVTVVEFADFQCPTCRQLHNVLREIAPSYPQVRFVFKDFPLIQIHPWAMTAALAARCVYEQSPESFWKVHDAIFDNQDATDPQNARSRMLDYATQAGLDPEKIRSCMDSPDATRAVQENMKEGQALKVANTPTVFVNGRRLIGVDRNLLEQYIQYELATFAAPPDHRIHNIHYQPYDKASEAAGQLFSGDLLPIF